MKDLNLQYSFVRGYVDGDGSIILTKPRLSIIGTPEFILELISRLNLKQNKLLQDRRGSIHTVNVNYSMKIGLNVLHLLYKNATIYLDRKYERYIQYCRLYEKS